MVSRKEYRRAVTLKTSVAETDDLYVPTSW